MTSKQTSIINCPKCFGSGAKPTPETLTTYSCEWCSGTGTVDVVGISPVGESILAKALKRSVKVSDILE